MNLLFDIISSQGSHYNGAAGYTKKLFMAIRGIASERLNINLFVIYDSRMPFIFKEMSLPLLCQDSTLKLIDIAQYKSVQAIIIKYNIDKLYICLAQRWNSYDLKAIDCQVYCTIHDMWHFESEGNNIDQYVQMDNIWYMLKRRIKKIISHGSITKRKFHRLIHFMSTTQQLTIVTVSEYSKKSIMYYLNIQKSRCCVFYSPSKIVIKHNTIDNPVLKDLIARRCKYYLVVSADRIMKNAKKILNAFHRYINVSKDTAVIVTVGMQKKIIKEQILLPYISESDLENAYANCYALVYGSLFEGFGYPPVEAMKYSRPVLASNVCSIPEILGDAPIYFSPFYESDIFKSLMELNDTNYQYYMNKSKQRATEIGKLQDEHLNLLVKKILA